MIQSDSLKSMLSGYWTGGKSPSPCTVTDNNFVHKSLSNWAVNFAVGCSHACRFCYVPSSSTNKLAPQLRQLGVHDPDSDWGDYVFLRTWDEKRFLKTLAAAETTPTTQLKPDGNRAIMLCSTTDPYQVFRHPDPKERAHLEEQGRFVVRRALELIRDHSTLNVRILTRSPLARLDFVLFKTFGPRLLFGMSLPTLRNDLSKIYEPKAPAPSVRLQTLKQAKDAGIPIFVAMAPTYPESDEIDLRATLTAIAQLNPVTVFHEPINIRAENVERIASHARALAVEPMIDVFANRESWQSYALDALHNVERLANDVGLKNQLHLWPDKSLGTQIALVRLPATERAAHLCWIDHWWTRISAWPNSEVRLGTS